MSDFTSTGMANFNNASFTGTVSFISLPSIPLTYGALLFGNNLNIATELQGGFNEQILTMSGGAPVWTSPMSVVPVDSVFGRTGDILSMT